MKCSIILNWRPRNYVNCAIEILWEKAKHQTNIIAGRNNIEETKNRIKSILDWLTVCSNIRRYYRSEPSLQPQDPYYRRT